MLSKDIPIGCLKYILEETLSATDPLIFADPLTLNSAPEEVLRLSVELGGSRSFLFDAAQTRGASTILTRKIGWRASACARLKTPVNYWVWSHLTAPDATLGRRMLQYERPPTGPSTKMSDLLRTVIRLRCEINRPRRNLLRQSTVPPQKR